MQVLVTGGAGFIGSHLVDSLLEKGYSVSVLDSLISGSRANLSKKASFYQYTLGEFFRRRPRIARPDIIYHLAAFSRVRPSHQNMLSAYRSNSQGTIQMLELAKEWSARLIYTSSGVAAQPDLNPYAYTKFLGEMHCRMYHGLYKTEAVVARLANVFGLREHQTGDYATVVGIFRRYYAQMKDLPIYGGFQKRDFIHVSDVVRALIALADRVISCERAFEIATGVSRTIRSVARLFPCPINILGEPTAEIDEVVMDPSYTRQALDWTPTVTLESYIQDFLRETSS